MKHINICVGTVYGGALETARAIQKEFWDQDVKATIYNNPVLENITSNQDPVLICTSTTGTGDLPENIAPLYLSLTTDFPNIVGRAFGVICLGDSSYGDTFCGAGQLMSDAFTELAAQQIREPLLIDAMETVDPVSEAVPWAVDWLKKLP